MPQSAEIVNDIKQVLEISSRVDERVKQIQVVQQELTARMNQMYSEFNQLTGRVLVLESKNGNKIHILEEEIDELEKRIEKIDFGGTEIMKTTIKEVNTEIESLDDSSKDMQSRLQMLEHSNQGWEGKVKYYSGLLMQAAWVIIVCYILWKLGINTPPIP